MRLIGWTGAEERLRDASPSSTRSLQPGAVATVFVNDLEALVTGAIQVVVGQRQPLDEIHDIAWPPMHSMFARRVPS
jgi:hypothetical protein